MYNIRRKVVNGVLGIFLLALANGAIADIKLPKLIGDNMVLQQNKPVRIWGWADQKERVQVLFQEETYHAKTKQGKWEVMLPATPAGGPYELIIIGNDSIKLSNILFGEVWVCSGQSNMQWTVGNSNNSEQEIKQASYPEIRLFTVPRRISPEPMDDIESGEWQLCSPESVPGFTAVGYFFGRELHLQLDVPIGLIHTSWGGTNVETWTSTESIISIDDFKPVIEDMKTVDLKSQLQDPGKAVKEWNKNLDESDIGLKNRWSSREVEDSDWPTMILPNLWEGEKNMESVDGVVWFRREIDIPPTAIFGGHTELWLGTIDDSDQTWVNGKLVGETHNQYNLIRKYMLRPGMLRPGKNVIAVRVIDTGGGGGIWGEPENLKVMTDNFSFSLVGEWKYKLGTKELTPRPGGIGPNSYPSLLFNGMLNPVTPYTIQGAIWYQGESNAGRAYQYRETFPLMIKDWRKHFGTENFPFYFVQLANFMEAQVEPIGSNWAELREAQDMTLSLPNTGMAVTIDIGNPTDIHPKNKQDVGKRLALNALAKTYNKNVVFSGPTLDAMEIDGSHAIIHFKNLGSGLKVQDRYGYVKGFTIAGEDQKFYWAKAMVKGDEVIVHANQVEKPVAVRYAWEDNPEDANLFNVEGLPACPFRTDEWQGVTYGVKYR